MRVPSFVKPGLLVVAGVGAGYAITDLLSGHAPGIPGIFPSLRLHISQVGVHIHHWVWASAGAATMFVVDRRHRTVFRRRMAYVIMGVLLGVTLQGFTYHDWSHVFYLR